MSIQTANGVQASVADILERAADRLSKPGAWGQGYFAFDREGEWVGEDEPTATRWCAMGALSVEAGGWDESLIARNALHDVVGGIEAFNDAPERTQTEVVTALRNAAQKARGQGA